MTRGPLRLIASTPERMPLSQDAQTLARMARGDIGALATLYDSYAPSLLRFTRSISSREDAEDLVQVTFLRAVQLASSFDERVASARPWLFAIAARLVRERRRSLRRYATALFSFAHHPHAPTENVAAEHRDLSRGLARLSDAKRMVLLLVEVEGFTCEEVAQMLAIPVGTVWTRLHHSRRDMRRFFEEAP